MQIRTLSKAILAGVTATVIAAAGLAIPELKKDEGLELVAYPDVGNVWSICYGETLGVKEGDTATEEQCEAQLQVRTIEFMVKVDRLISVETPPLALSALGRFAYNTGIGAFETGSVRRLINQKKFAEGCDAMLAYRNAGYLTEKQMKKLYPERDPKKPLRRNCSIKAHGCPGMWNRRLGEVADCRAGFGLGEKDPAPLVMPTKSAPKGVQAKPPNFWDKAASWLSK